MLTLKHNESFFDIYYKFEKNNFDESESDNSEFKTIHNGVTQQI